MVEESISNRSLKTLQTAAGSCIKEIITVRYGELTLGNVHRHRPARVLISDLVKVLDYMDDMVIQRENKAGL